MKNTVEVFPPYLLLAVRFTLSLAFISMFFFKKYTLLNFQYLWQGGVMGFLLFFGFVVQTFGLQTTTPGVNAFLTATYCVIVPFLFWAVNKTRPDMYNYLSALICICGIGLVSVTGKFTIGTGDMLTILCGFFFAAHMVSIAVFTKKNDAVLLTMLQFAFASLFSWVIGAFTERFPAEVSPNSIAGLFYLAFFATMLAMLLQNVGQARTHPSAAAIILSLESVFGVLFSVLFYGERLTVKLFFGFLLIFIAVIISETKLDFLRKRKRNQ